jgi:hypothetical protein
MVLIDQSIFSGEIEHHSKRCHNPSSHLITASPLKPAGEVRAIRRGKAVQRDAGNIMLVYVMLKVLTIAFEGASFALAGGYEVRVINEEQTAGLSYVNTIWKRYVHAPG